MTVTQFLTARLQGIGVTGLGETPSGDELNLALFHFNELLDSWNSDERAQYAVQFLPFTLTPNLDPHTIGPTGATFTVTTNRPNRIIGANLVLNTNSPAVNTIINVNDSMWWLGQPVPTQATSVPTDLWYQPAWPNGNIFFWPVPTVAYGVRLEIEVLLAQVALNTTFTLPPGYQMALGKTLEETLVGPFQVPMPPSLPGQALEARARCFSDNDEIPRITTDAGFGVAGDGKGLWNYRTGRVTN